MLKEQRRRAYLHAMGLQVYYPRRPLPGAHPSPRYELPDLAPPARLETDAANSRPPATQPEARSEAVTGRARKMLDASQPSRGLEPTAKPQAKSTAPQAAEQASEPTDALRFLLRYYPIDSRLAVLSEFPHDRRQADDRGALQLLQAILLALGIEWETGGAHGEPFSWPLLADMPGSTATPAQARQALSGFVAKCRERDQFANLLVFSAQVDELLPSAQAAGANADYEPANAQYRIVRTRSLHSMLALPALKKEVWEHLQPLRRRLQ